MPTQVNLQATFNLQSTSLEQQGPNLINIYAPIQTKYFLPKVSNKPIDFPSN